MKPKEKARDLINKFSLKVLDTHLGGSNRRVIDCALISVDEIIKSRKEDKSFNDYLSATGSEYYTPHPMYLTYWEKVKQELEKLKNK
jgi:hypothetical protein